MSDINFEVVKKPLHVTKYGKLLEALRRLEPDEALRVDITGGDMNAFRNRFNTVANKAVIQMRSKMIDGKLLIWKREDEDEDEDERPEGIS